jgi:hypothetical protein
MSEITDSIDCAKQALKQATDAVKFLVKPEMGLTNLAPIYLDASASVLEQTAQVFRSRALELRRATDGGLSPLPENGASDKAEPQGKMQGSA